MVSKPKKRQVLKVSSVVREHPKSPKPQDNSAKLTREKIASKALNDKSLNRDKPQDKPSSAEALIIMNGTLVESLLAQEGWHIVEELIDEGVASVSGRKTNGYYYNGAITGSKDKQYLTGYQEGLTQLYNRIKDYIKAKDNVIKSKKDEEASINAPVYDPFMEDSNEEA